KVIAFTGSNTFANEREILDLYLAVKLLNEQGVLTRLIRTGFNSPQFIESLPSDWRTWTIDLGFVEKSRLPELLALSDVLVQPGQPGRFNDFRLPSKLPEYLASGRPVVTIASNLGLELQDGRNAIVLQKTQPQDIADACRRVFEDPDAAARIGSSGALFAREHFDLSRSSRRLATFYSELAARPLRSTWSASTDGGDVTLLSRHLEDLLQSLPAPSTPLWTEILSMVGDFSLLSRQLETSAEHAERTLRNACDKLEKERDEWKHGWMLTDQHAKNITATLDATRFHAANLERTLAAFEKDRDRAEAHREHVETLLRSARNQVQSFETALVEAESALARKADTLAIAEQRLEATQNHAKNLQEALAITREDLARNDQGRQRIESELTSAGAKITAL
ncbi:MAG TPA: glycosyltransferase, partial [Opitutaceae bacterium]|nr:glycosyltransferase [Opitutaceae bacterium]